MATQQGGITCGAIEEASISSKTIDKHVIIIFCDKNAIVSRSRDKMILNLYDKNAIYYQARALRALGLLLADGTPTVGGGKTF